MSFTWGCTIFLNAALPAVMLWRGTWRRLPYLFEAQALSAALTVMLVVAYYSPLVDRESYENGWVLADGVFILINAISAWDLMNGGRLAILLSIGFYMEAMSRLAIYAADIWSLNSTAYSGAEVYFDLALMLAAIVLVYHHGKEDLINDREMRNEKANPYTSAETETR